MTVPPVTVGYIQSRPAEAQLHIVPNSVTTFSAAADFRRFGIWTFLGIRILTHPSPIERKISWNISSKTFSFADSVIARLPSVFSRSNAWSMLFPWTVYSRSTFPSLFCCFLLRQAVARAFLFIWALAAYRPLISVFVRLMSVTHFVSCPSTLAGCYCQL